MSKELPLKLGRYEIAGEIAMGGMAQLLLGRLTGPGGFERPVVLKRILRQYARVPAFREMFLDEARIAASISHPNVVQHFELGESGDELFLVMEYLEGEPASSVARRALLSARPLPIELAVHIVACAAAGLHAAHRGTDLDGAPREVVHRDVSPQNVFVGYDGQVKVIDFGIAKAKDRITQTEAGMLKGKYAYMSPEQARGESIDHRSDVFALGIVLYELTTRHRLFHRATPLASLRAVELDPIVAPSTLVPDYPPELERICLRALCRERSERHQSAAELRTDLLDAMHVLGARAEPQAALSALMHDLFAHRIEEHAELLRRMRRGSVIEHMPTVDDVDISVEPIAGEITTARARPTAPPPRPTSNLRTLTLAALVLGLIAAAITLWTSRTSEVSPTPAPIVVAATTERAPAAETPHSAPSVAITIASVPPGALVELDGRSLGLTPHTLDVPRSDAPLTLLLRLEGHDPLTAEVVPDVQQRLSFSLVRTRRRDRPSPASAPPATPAAIEAPPSATFPRFE